MTTVCPHCGGEFVLDRSGHHWKKPTRIGQFLDIPDELICDENGLITKRQLWIVFPKLTPKEISQTCWQMVRQGYWRRVKLNVWVKIKNVKMEKVKDVRQKD